MTTTSTPMGTSRYHVGGMTCGHCVMAVTRELNAVPGVREVSVSLAAGDVTVVHDQPLDRDQVAAAIYEAGYQLTD
jgi:copper chaperone CopZ